jgi:hypothetical protein
VAACPVIDSYKTAAKAFDGHEAPAARSLQTELGSTAEGALCRRSVLTTHAYTC